MSKAKAQQTEDYNNLLGILFMLINALSIAILYVAIKELTQDISSNLVVFLYKFTILILILPWCFKGGIKSLKTKRIWLHASRGFFSIAGSLSLFYAIKFIDLTDITAMGYIEQVILVIIGILYFKEKATKSKIAVIVASFLGAVIIVYPDLAEFNDDFVPLFIANRSLGELNPYYIFVFLAIAFWATNCTVIKVLGRSEKTKVQLFYVMLFSCIISAPLAFLGWEEVTEVAGLPIKYPNEFLAFTELGLKAEHIKYILLLALCYFAHSVTFFHSLKRAEMSVVIPYDYSRLVFTGIMAYFFFNEIPEPGAYTGYVLIVGAGIYLIRAEAKRRRKPKIHEIEEEFEHA